MPLGRSRPVLRGRRRHRPGAEDARWRREGRARSRGCRGGRAAASSTSHATSRTCSKFGLPVVVALNRFTSDTDAEIDVVRDAMARLDAQICLCTHWADGAAGAAALARAVRARDRCRQRPFRPIYPDDLPLAEKVRTIAREIYRAADVSFPAGVRSRKRARSLRGGRVRQCPVCIAKTQYSFSADPRCWARRPGMSCRSREVRLSAGAGFVVAIAGDIMTMPGLPRVPAAESHNASTADRPDHRPVLTEPLPWKRAGLVSPAMFGDRRASPSELRRGERPVEAAMQPRCAATTQGDVLRGGGIRMNSSASDMVS